MTPTRYTPRVLVIAVRGDVALLKPGGRATATEVRDLARYVMVEPCWSREGRGYVVPAVTVPDVRAGAELQGSWIVRDARAVA
jgi:hypothetical protein